MAGQQVQAWRGAECSLERTISTLPLCLPPTRAGRMIEQPPLPTPVPAPPPPAFQVMLPPSARGNVSWIAPAGSYSIEDKVIEVEFGGVKKVGSN